MSTAAAGRGAVCSPAAQSSRRTRRGARPPPRAWKRKTHLKGPCPPQAPSAARCRWRNTGKTAPCLGERPPAVSAPVPPLPPFLSSRPSRRQSWRELGAWLRKRARGPKRSGAAGSSPGSSLAFLPVLPLDSPLSTNGYKKISSWLKISALCCRDKASPFVSCARGEVSVPESVDLRRSWAACGRFCATIGAGMRCCACPAVAPGARHIGSAVR